MRRFWSVAALLISSPLLAQDSTTALNEVVVTAPDLSAVLARCETVGAELLVDAYHALGAMPFALPAMGLGSAWIVGGGYKYLQLGEGNCFLRLPPHARGLRPAVTGWYAEFDALADAARPGLVPYGRGAAAFAGSTYDPTSHYRAARVMDFFGEQGLTPEALRASYRRQVDLLAARFDALGLDDALVGRDRSTPLDRFGAFLALDTPRAAALQRALAARGVLADSRGRHLRLGPAPYLDDAQLEAAVERLGEAARELRVEP